MVIDRGDFWEFKARTIACDLELAKLRVQIAAVTQQKDAIVDAFAAKYGLDAQRPLRLEDTDCSVTQQESNPGSEA